MKKNIRPLRQGFCIFINAFFQGPVPSVSDNNKCYVFKTEVEAQREIIDFAMIRMQEFLDGERDFHDAISIEEYLVAVTIQSDGSFLDEHGRRYESKVD